MSSSIIPTCKSFDSSSVDEATCSLVEATDSSSTTTNQPTDHPLLATLLTRRPALGTISDKTDLINKLLQPEVIRFLKETLKDAVFNSSLQSWFSKYSILIKSSKSWKKVTVANCLCEFDSLLKSFFLKAPTAIAQAVIPSCIKSFQEYMDVTVTEVRTLIITEETSKAVASTRRKRLGKQNSGECLQDQLDLARIKATDFESVCCAKCNHSFLYATDSAAVVNERNESKRKVHESEMTTWEKTSKRNRGTKPKAPKLESQTLACLCVVLTCNNRQNGAGCYTCKIACENAKKAANNHGRPFFDVNHQCTCDVCQCKCRAVYKRHEHAEVL